jgi:hypothetical protein
MEVIYCIMRTFCLFCQQNSATWYVFMTLKISVVVFWVMTPLYCSLVGGYHITCLINDSSLLTKPWQCVPKTIFLSYSKILFLHSLNSFLFKLNYAIQKSHSISIYRIFSNLIRTFFYRFRGLKNQMRIRFAVESWILEKWYSRCTCCKNNRILSFIILFITVGAWGGRSANATTNGPRKRLGTTPVDSYG